MDFKKEATEELQKYALRKASLQSLIEELAQINADLKSIGGKNMSSSPVNGGGLVWEDEKINLLVRRDKVTTALQFSRSWIKKVERSLEALSEEDRLILERSFIYRSKGYISRLCEELNVEKTAAYLKRDAALMQYTIARFGWLEV